MRTPFISIIFPTFNGWLDTKECLESITKLDYPKTKIEVIIIDNGSTDETVKKVKSLILIENRVNLGFAKAVNQGIKKAKGEYLLITNNDVVFDKNYLNLLITFLQNHPIVGITGGKAYYKKPKNKIAFAGARFGFYTGILSPNKTPNQIFQTDWVSGCNMLVKREVFESIGLFDEQFFFYFEDLDLCLRAKRAGYKVIYYPKAILYHGEGISINKQNWQIKSQYYYDGKTRILFKHGTKLQLICGLIFQFTAGLVYQLFILKHQNYTPALKAFFNNIKEYIRTRRVMRSGGSARQRATERALAEVQPAAGPVANQLQLEVLPSITIVSPTLNGKLLIPHLLNSIRNQNYPWKKIEVIVLDNASTDGTPDIIKKNFPWVKLIILPKNTGSAPPITMGAKIAQGDYILATNDDVIFEKNCLSQLIELATSDERIGIVTGKMMTYDSPHRPLFFGFRVNPYLGYQTYDFSDTDKVRETDWAPGACLLIKKGLLKGIGYFDDDYIFCGDDHDVCFQVRSFGYKIMYNPKAIYYHGFTRAGGQHGPSQENLFAHYRGKIRFMLKNANPPQIATFLITQIVFGPIYSYFKFGNKTIIPLFRALLWNTRHINRTFQSRKIANQRKINYLK